MKPFFLTCVLILSPNIAAAMDQGPIFMYFANADTIYLVKTRSVNQHQITFSITETLRGNPVKVLTLSDGILVPNAGPEFLILSNAATRNGNRGNTVGDLMKGNLGWLYAQVLREGSGTYVEGSVLEGDSNKTDKVINGVGCLTLDHVKALLKQNSQEN